MATEFTPEKEKRIREFLIENKGFPNDFELKEIKKYCGEQCHGICYGPYGLTAYVGISPEGVYCHKN